MNIDLFYIYRLYDSKDSLLYLGITNDTDRRIREHKQSADWFYQVARTDIRRFDCTRKNVEIEEISAIKREQPKFNILHNSGGAESRWQKIRGVQKCIRLDPAVNQGLKNCTYLLRETEISFIERAILNEIEKTKHLHGGLVPKAPDEWPPHSRRSPGRARSRQPDGNLL